MKAKLLDFIEAHELSDDNIRLYSTLSNQSHEPSFYYDELGVFDMDELLDLPTVSVEKFSYNKATNLVHVILSIFSLDELETSDLRVSQTTEGMNGYPKDLKNVLIGFSDWDEVEKLIEEYPFLQAVELTKMDGQSYWKNVGERYGVFSIFTAEEQINIKGCDWTIFKPDSDLLVLQETLSTFSVEDVANDPDKYKNMIEKFANNCDYYDDLESDEILLVDSYGDTEILSPSMEFHEDVTTHTIGLIIKE